jgi:hypothetical protein
MTLAAAEFGVDVHRVSISFGLVFFGGVFGPHNVWQACIQMATFLGS